MRCFGGEKCARDMTLSVSCLCLRSVASTFGFSLCDSRVCWHLQESFFFLSFIFYDNIAWEKRGWSIFCFCFDDHIKAFPIFIIIPSPLRCDSSPRKQTPTEHSPRSYPDNSFDIKPTNKPGKVHPWCEYSLSTHFPSLRHSHPQPPQEDEKRLFKEG